MKMELYEKIDLSGCPVCGGTGYLDEESGAGYMVSCLDCGSHSVAVSFSRDEQREAAALKTAQLWNAGKVISSDPGE